MSKVNLRSSTHNKASYEVNHLLKLNTEDLAFTGSI